MSCPTYADDVELVASSPKDCQKSIDIFQMALGTRTLKAKPPKCRSLAFRLFRRQEKTEYKRVLSSMYSSYDPLLKINNVPIKFIGDDDPPMFKYLGRYLQYDLKDDFVVRQTEEKLLKWLKIVDEALLDGRMKAWIINMHVCETCLAVDGSKLSKAGCANLDRSHSAEVSQMDWIGKVGRRVGSVSLQ